MMVGAVSLAATRQLITICRPRVSLWRCLQEGANVRALHSSATDTSCRSTTKDTPCKIVLIFDTETTGKVDFKSPPSDPTQPDLVQLGMLLVDTATWITKSQASMVVKLREGVQIESGAQDTHGISAADCDRLGVQPDTAARLFYDMYNRADILVAHNLAFDAAVMEAALNRSDLNSTGNDANFDTMISIGDLDKFIRADGGRKQRVCTMQSSTDLLKIPARFGSGYKWPSLSEAYQYVADKELEGGHDALVDCMACLQVFRYLVEEGAVSLDDGADKATNGEKKEDEEKDSPPPIQTSKRPEGVLVQRTSRGFTVSGKTFMIKEALKSHGGKWDWRRKEWRFTDSSSLSAIQALAGLEIESK